MKKIIVTLVIVIAGLIAFMFNNSKTLNNQINTLKQENITLRKKLSEKPQIPANRTLDVYNKSYITLMERYPECAKNFAVIMSFYE